MKLNNYEIKRLQYIIDQASKQTYIGVGPGDAVIIAKLIQKDVEELQWQESLSGVKEGLKNETKN